MAAPDLAALLAALPDGKTMWIEVRGRSMWPALMPGDRLLVRRCEPHELELGDVAVMARPDGQLVSHLVRTLDPLRTVSFVGREDAGLTTLGRAIAFRRGKLEVKLWPSALLTAQRAYEAAVRSPLFRAWRFSVELATSASTREARRRLLGPVTVSTLTAGELHEAALALSRWESPSPAALEQAVHDGRVCAARGPSGKIVGMAIDGRTWVLERYAGLGLEDELTRRSRSSHQGG